MASGEWGRRLRRLGWVVSLLALSATALDAGTLPVLRQGRADGASVVAAVRSTPPAGIAAGWEDAPATVSRAFEAVGDADR